MNNMMHGLKKCPNDLELSVEILEAVNIEYHYSGEETAPDGLTLDEEIEWLFSDVDMEPAGATREERKAAREDKRKQRNGPVLNISFSEAVDYINFEESTNALKGPYIRVPDYVCDKDFTDEDFDKWVMSL